MLNLPTKRIVLIREVIWLKKTYREYVPRKENTKAYYYILKNEYEYYKLAHVKIYPVNNEVMTEKIKTEEIVKTEQYLNK